MAALAEVFARTGGVDPNSAVMEEVAPTSEFLEAFRGAQNTGANGAGPILNANANLIPTRADQYRESDVFNDFRLGNGIGISRSFRRPDSMGGQVAGGFQGNPVPNKMFGRSDRSHDLNFNRVDMQERANMSLKKMGFKNNEVPEGAYLKPWDWNNTQALGIGSHGHQFNRHYGVPDADAVARRLYEPTPSRKTKMISTDVETQFIRPNSTRMHPMTVVSHDRQREKSQRIPKNTDVAETVIYENIFPRGMSKPNGQEAVKVWGDASVLRQPIGTNDTGDRSIYGIWRNGHDPMNGGALLAESMDDHLTLYKDHTTIDRGQDIAREIVEFLDAQTYLNNQEVPDPNRILPDPREFPNNASGISGPLHTGVRNTFSS